MRSRRGIYREFREGRSTRIEVWRVVVHSLTLSINGPDFCQQSRLAHYHGVTK